MKKKILAVIIAVITMSNAMAQKETKYVKIFYKNYRIETGDLVITVDNAVSTAGETNFKLKIENKTNDYIIYKPEESKFMINGKDVKASEKWEIIEPNDYGTLVVGIKGAQYNEVKDYSFLMDGLYKVPADAKGIPAPDFKLPASQNDFKTGNFTCTLSKLTKESDKTEVKFKCSYNGDKIGFVFPSKIAVKMPDGNDYANAAPKKKKKAIMLMKGKEEDFTAEWERMNGGKTMDMQKVEMIIKWNDTFSEVSPVKIKPETLELQFDETVSNAKGK